MGAQSSESPPAGGAGQWVRFTDPVEQAFSINAPAGWSVSGGTVRHAPTCAQPVLRALSPDRRIYLFIGDPYLTHYVTPPWLQGLLGIPDGTPLAPGYTQSRYITGSQFALDYALRTLSSLCPHLTLTAHRSRPDLAHAPFTLLRPYAQREAGEAQFRCEQAAAAAVGWVTASTYIFEWAPGVGRAYWGVEFLAGAIAPPGQIEWTTQQLLQMFPTLRFDPAWVSRERAAVAQLQQSVDAGTQQHLAAAVQQAAGVQQAWQDFSARQRAHCQREMSIMDRQFESFDRVITGVSPFADDYGNTYMLDNSKTQWIGPYGRTIGNDGASPGPEWRKMSEVPPQ
jgi:hypothetical protein